MNYAWTTNRISLRRWKMKMLSTWSLGRTRLGGDAKCGKIHNRDHKEEWKRLLEVNTPISGWWLMIDGDDCYWVRTFSPIIEMEI
jgi:hypothetical protein